MSKTPRFQISFRHTDYRHEATSGSIHCAGVISSALDRAAPRVTPRAARRAFGATERATAIRHRLPKAACRVAAPNRDLHPVFYQRQTRSPPYRRQRNTVPLRTIAQLRSPTPGSTHKAAVRLPLAGPSERHRIAGAATRTCPVDATPCDPPSSFTSWSRAARPVAFGQGCPGLHVSPISRAAIPSRRMRGPSAHQIGPSPSHTRVGVQVNVVPAATIEARTRAIMSLSASHTRKTCPQASARDLEGKQGWPHAAPWPAASKNSEG